MPVRFVLRMLTPLHSITDKGQHEKYYFLPRYGKRETSLMTACTPSHSEKAKAAKGTFQDEATLKNAEMKPIALAVIELHLSEGISQVVR